MKFVNHMGTIQWRDLVQNYTHIISTSVNIDIHKENHYDIPNLPYSSSNAFLYEVEMQKQHQFFF